MNLSTISVVGDTHPQGMPGSSCSASAAASPVVCMPMTTQWPSASAAFASATIVGTLHEMQRSLKNRYAVLRSLQNSTALLYSSVCPSSRQHSTSQNSASRKLSPLATYLPPAFISMASNSINVTPLCFRLARKLSKSWKADPGPHSPMRFM
eukprot:CAMPEP_0117694018 /NCGR_PEP_ID=MMETSP0804-20121206/27209_1 /TAXON_ID=1074897 /ORGANISM="Tetraselmis astigmatica, Strain CCMP880" /LENGTH=151 /DNA_ID=CAMNT_0005507649 /DNA_START=219 /DNA_END=674 /DNA_ORIENTATION=+